MTPVPCVASVSVGLGSKESQRNGIFGDLLAGKMVQEPERGGGEGSTTPSFVLWPSPRLSRGQNTENFGLSLLPNPTETLAMQAMTPEVYYGGLAKTYKFPPHGTKTYPLMKYLAVDIEGSKAKKKLATLNLKLASLRI